jgi:hypothetical protein
MSAAPEPTPIPAVNPPPEEPSAKPVVEAVRAAVAPPRIASPRPVVTNAASNAEPDTFEDETQALRSALSGLRAGRADSALAALDEQDTRFRRGALGEERAVARIETLCALGRTREAGEKATLFLTQHPRSVQAARVRASCGAPKSQ